MDERTDETDQRIWSFVRNMIAQRSDVRIYSRLSRLLSPERLIVLPSSPFAAFMR
ncbi:hypothetical protein WN55_05535 [Dufourea novaeangliae]|uniref:Uncharacterized protein n=1 Tax=Dufourea novaeangliae TaxID=178035 RepID=A0A154PMN4_DUFNO|nr:hypothetical protein WN55_05535 [Dufourea novaeangliae]